MFLPIYCLFFLFLVFWRTENFVQLLIFFVQTKTIIIILDILWNLKFICFMWVYCMMRDVWCFRLEFCKILTLWVNGRPEMHNSLLLFKASYEAYGKWVFFNKEVQFMQKLRLIFLFCKLGIFLDLMEPRGKKLKKSLEK